MVTSQGGTGKTPHPSFFLSDGLLSLMGLIQPVARGQAITDIPLLLSLPGHRARRRGGANGRFSARTHKFNKNGLGKGLQRSSYGCHLARISLSLPVLHLPQVLVTDLCYPCTRMFLLPRCSCFTKHCYVCILAFITQPQNGSVTILCAICKA